MKSSVGSAGFFASLVQSTGKGGKVKGKGNGNISALFGASFLKVTSPLAKGVSADTKAKSPIQVSPDILKKLITTADKAEVKEALKKIAGELEKLGDTLGIGKEVKAKIEKLLSSDEELSDEALEAVLFSFVEVLSTLQDMKDLITGSGLESISLEDGEEVNLTEMATMLDEVTQNIGKNLQKAGVSPVLIKMAKGETVTATGQSEVVQLSEKELALLESVLQKVKKATVDGQTSRNGLADQQRVAPEMVTNPVKGVKEEVPVLLTSLLSKLKGNISKVTKVIAKAGTDSKKGKLQALGALKGEGSLEKSLTEKNIAVSSRKGKENKSPFTAGKGVQTGMALSGERNKVSELINFSAEFSHATADGDELVQNLSSKITQAGKSGKGQQVGFSTLAERLFESQVMQQVNSRVTSAVKDGLHVINIKLRPEHLGDVSIKLQVEGDVVTAKINVENQQVKQIIENNFQNLRDSLEEQNLYAGSLDVNVGSDGSTEFKEFAQEFGIESKGLHADEVYDDELFVEEEGVGVDTGRRFGTNSFEYSA